jgi:hypothetical protein
MEIWISPNLSDYSLRATVPSNNNHYVIAEVVEGDADFWFKIRYRNGAAVGPFSDVFHIGISI